MQTNAGKKQSCLSPLTFFGEFRAAKRQTASGRVRASVRSIKWSCGHNEMMTNTAINHPVPRAPSRTRTAVVRVWKMNTERKLELMKSERWIRVHMFVCRWLCYACHQDGGRGVVAPRCSAQGGVQSRGVRGEGVTWKYPQSPKDGCQCNRGEDGYWTSRHFFSVSSHITGSLSLQQVGLKRSGVWGFGAGASKWKRGAFPVVNHSWAALSLWRFDGREWWILLALGLGSQTAIITPDPADSRAHLDKWRGLLIFEGSHV